MDEIKITEMKDEKEIDFLFGRSSFNYTYDKDTIDLLKKHFQLKDSLYLIVRRENKFVGFCSIDRGWWEDNFFFIREILVDSSFQKLGIGKKLMQKCIEHAKDKKAIGVVTETDFENCPMQNLCKKLNFIEWKNPQWKEGLTYKLLF